MINRVSSTTLSLHQILLGDFLSFHYFEYLESTVEDFLNKQQQKPLY